MRRSAVLAAALLILLSWVRGVDPQPLMRSVQADPAAPVLQPLDEPSIAAQADVLRNSDWTPVIQRFAGVPMALVPPGCFWMGMTDDAIAALIRQRSWYEHEDVLAFGPQHRQCFDEPFWIDQTEVTQADFARLGGMKAGGNRFTGDQRPVENISWFEARDFCALRGGRLPTEVEWEYAARGPDSLIYPWGNDWNADNPVWRENAGMATAEVGSRPAGASWVGALDMSGNVWEWLSSLYAPYPYDGEDGREADTGTATGVLRGMRGGSWFYNDPNGFRADYRRTEIPVARIGDIGFRCVRSF